jgi:hypothetical protein
VLGALYRYPHPHDANKWIYCGQGPKRDRGHRFGKSSFGRRFKKVFPGVELPKPIREEVEVRDYLELNELETIWMFQYHTWHGYPDGMNLLVPGSADYENLGSIGGPIGGKATNATTNGRKGNGGRISGHKNVESGQIRALGLAQGRRNVESGHIQALGRTQGRVQGPIQGLIQGRKNVKSGQLAGIRTRENCAKGGSIQGLKNIESGQLAGLRTPEHQRAAGRIGGLKNVESGWAQELGRRAVESGHIQALGHIRWHVNRGLKSPNCFLCQTNLSIQPQK